MTPNPNPSPELRPCPFCGDRMEDRGYGAMHTDGARCILAGYAFEAHTAWNTRALSPQTLPAPGEVELREAYIAGFAQALYNLELTPNAFFDAWLDFGRYYGLEKEQFDPDVIHTSTLATVAAANDEGVARDLLRGSFDSAFQNAKSWYTEDAAVEAMVQFAGTVREATAQVADRQAASCQREADSRLPGPEKDAWQRAAEEVAMTAAAIRLLPQGGGK